jgi:hypothetical protein
MKRFIRYTGKASLGIAALVMILHLLIPHDHHQENLCIHQDNTPVSENHHHNRMPAHCHAFNDLTSEEKSIVIAKTVSFDNFTAIIDIFHIKFICEFSGEIYYDFFPRLQSSGEPELSSLRAPPSFS